MTQEALNVGPDATPAVTFHEKPYRHYKVNGIKVPSVTQVIGLLDKPALKHWAQKEAVRGVCELALQYGADDAIFRDVDRLEAAIIGMGRELNTQTFVDLYTQQDCTLPWERPGDVLQIIKRSEVSINARMKQAQERGVSLHKAWEDYADTGKIPNPDLFPKEHHGYLTATARFMQTHRPKFTTAELVVGSQIHGYGGRLDFLAYLEIGDGHGLLDLKTNAAGKVYAVEHFIQVEAYALAATECGHDVGDWRGVVAIGAGGNFQFRRSFAEAGDFLALLEPFKRIKRLKQLDKEDQR